MGGILIWATVLIITISVEIAAWLSPESFLGKFAFLSRKETWLPLFTLVSASILGLVDDLMVIKDTGKYSGGGMRFKVRLALILLIAAAGAWWFYAKLGVSYINIPFYGNVELGLWFPILFILVIVASYSTSVVDGLDGLSAGVLLPIFLSFGAIAYVKGLYDLVAFLTVVVSALVTYLWFNVHPARFYMGETGIMGLTVTLAVVAFLTNSVLLLPLIGFVLVLESASVILQLLSKKIFKRKILLAAPIHHHFQGLGWEESQITMRFWIVSWVFSIFGLVIFFLSRLF
jgi:phospho-N-acetylmuramoyl-pentapeptide-transferase